MPEAPNLQAHLFFSYAHADADRLRAFHERLEVKTGRYIWIDRLMCFAADVLRHPT